MIFNCIAKTATCQWTYIHGFVCQRVNIDFHTRDRTKISTTVCIMSRNAWMCNYFFRTNIYVIMCFNILSAFNGFKSCFFVDPCNLNKSNIYICIDTSKHLNNSYSLHYSSSCEVWSVSESEQSERFVSIDLYNA